MPGCNGRRARLLRRVDSAGRIGATLTSQTTNTGKGFVVAMFLSFALGMIVALFVYVLWRSHPADLQHLSATGALIICPPFVLSYAIGAAPASDFALALGAGTIILANAFLYAGVAAGIYAGLAVLRKRKG
jgi:hypothetical protein